MGAAEDEDPLLFREIEDILGDGIIAGDEERASAVFDSVALDDWAVAADHEEVGVIAIFDGEFEALVDGFLGGSADEEDEVFFFGGKRVFATDAFGVEGFGKVGERGEDGADAESRGVAGEEEFQEVEVSQEAADVAIFVFDRDAADLGIEHALVGGEEGIVGFDLDDVLVADHASGGPDIGDQIRDGDIGFFEDPFRALGDFAAASGLCIWFFTD